MFNAKNSLDKYALKPGTDERRHVTGISWLFAMIGFRTIFLGNVDSTDEKTSRTQPEHSCDILLSDATCIFVVDCTSSTPFGNKITKIYNTAKYVKENINEESHHGIDVIPVIVSSEDCSGLKVDARKSHVTLIDKNDIENLYKLLLDGLKTEAMQYFNALITSFRQ